MKISKLLLISIGVVILITIYYSHNISLNEEILQIQTKSESNPNLIPFNNRKYLLNGMNIAWNNYGWDFGESKYGHGYDPKWWDNTFQQVSNYGCNSVRIWIHCDGSLSPEFDQQGMVTGLNKGMIDDLIDCLNIAKKYNLMVNLNLWDFLLYNTQALQLLKDDQKLQSYINNALIPMVTGLEQQTNLLAWEIINEPEWLQDRQQASWAEVQNFVGQIANSIHENSKRLVTVGSASIKWNSDVNPAVGNKWSDQRLKDASKKDKAYLDIYQIHYYDWMHQWKYTPFDHDFNYWKLDKPTIIGEIGKSQYYENWQLLQEPYDNQYGGVWFWAYKSGGSGTFDDYKNDLEQFYKKYQELIGYKA